MAPSPAVCVMTLAILLFNFSVIAASLLLFAASSRVLILSPIATCTCTRWLHCFPSGLFATIHTPSKIHRSKNLNGFMIT